MDRTRDETLARAGFSGHQDRRTTRGHGPHHIVDAGHSRVIADQTRDSLAHASAKRAVLPQKGVPRDGAGDGLTQFFIHHRLHEIVGCPEFEGTHRRLNAAVAGEHDERRGRVSGRDLLEQCESVAAGQVQIAEREVVFSPRFLGPCEGFERGFGGAHGFHFVSVP